MQRRSLSQTYHSWCNKEEFVPKTVKACSTVCPKTKLWNLYQYLIDLIYLGGFIVKLLLHAAPVIAHQSEQLFEERHLFENRQTHIVLTITSAVGLGTNDGMLCRRCWDSVLNSRAQSAPILSNIYQQWAGDGNLPLSVATARLRVAGREI